MSNILEETQIHLNENAVLIKGNDSTVGLYKVLFEYPEIRLDRLSKKAKDLYKDYYKTNVKKCYPKLDIQELEEIESHFFVNVNIYRFNGKKAVMERHSGKEYRRLLI
ncbi:hypothetical protein BDEG_26593 [Batrachochytrium dendrobatidis JEL423]|uniref:Uncharacterized protein n=1 Tax=Batrachochytrium dendrobatidis (strain JEL423) TaxID=403673 RepID=A0A177WUV9_BATDL|nr:hypothetical protein BDEG_26593 [Batrachochytrium dendrobatidis JEL423]